LSDEAARWASELVEQGRFTSMDKVVEPAMVLYRAEIESEHDVNWGKAHALAAAGRAQIARGEYIEFKDAAAMDAHFKWAIQRMKDG
jgi:Arc/MetJ-type ribon-helix-helix transcriptional regulator